MTTLRDIADNNGLILIATTDQPSGYPSNILKALIGFDNFDQAKGIASKFGLTMATFTKRDGWQLWYRSMGAVIEPFTVSSDDYGDNYQEFEKIDETEFIKNEVIPAIEGCDSFCDLEKILKQKSRLFDEIEEMDDEQIVIADEGVYFDTVNRKSMYTEIDTKHCAIGLIDLNNRY